MSTTDINHSWGQVNASLLSLDFEVDVEITKSALLHQEDTTQNGQITIEDNGPRAFTLQDTNGDKVEIVGVYQLSNLLQELTLASNASQSTTIIHGARIAENPVDRLTRVIPQLFWPSLIRRLDGPQILRGIRDNKADAGTQVGRIYIPHARQDQYDYYSKVAQQESEVELEVVHLPSDLQDAALYSRLMRDPGLMALELQDGKGSAYIVPGGRFNEFYYWDSYFAALGLLESDMVDLVCDMVNNMRYQINHYGCVLNANRSYYLNRSQPPFLSDLVIKTYHKLSSMGRSNADDFLKDGILSAIKEYHNVWMTVPRLDPSTGLSRYHSSGRGRGVPPEVEKGHFNWFLNSHAEAAGLTVDELSEQYNNGSLQSHELDEFFRHDRAMRESGHDTSRRMTGQCADLANIDLNSLLYKYETDIAWAIENKFGDELSVPAGIVPGVSSTTTYNSAYWKDKASNRQSQTTKYLWNEKTGIFHDYNTASKEQTPFQSATTFFSLWSGLATQEQAERLVKDGLPRLERVGGIVSTLEMDDSSPTTIYPSGQWDAPHGWAPHQMMLWEGLRKYGFDADAKRMAYRWLYLLTRIAVENNGRITERYDVTRLGKSSQSDGAEYGNQGCDFKGVNLEGFGWTNASYQCGISMLGEKLLAKLRQGLSWDEI